MLAGAFAAPADLFATANFIARRASNKEDPKKPLFRLMTASIDGKPVICGNQQSVNVDFALSEVQNIDVVIVPGLLVDSADMLLSMLSQLTPLSSFLRQMSDNGAIIAAPCTGAFILAETGMLDFQEATTTWWLSNEFRERYPKVVLDDIKLVADAENLVTGAAGASYMDLSLHLISKLAGSNLARMTGAYLCLDGPRESQSAYAIPYHRQVRDPFIEKADRWIRQHSGETLNVSGLARHLGVSTRTMARRFKAVNGKPPSDYIQRVRIDKAKYILHNSTKSIGQIAGEVGYKDEDAFRRAFTKHVGQTPTSYRRKAN